MRTLRRWAKSGPKRGCDSVCEALSRASAGPPQRSWPRKAGTTSRPLSATSTTLAVSYRTSCQRCSRSLSRREGRSDVRVRSTVAARRTCSTMSKVAESVRAVQQAVNAPDISRRAVCGISHDDVRHSPRSERLDAAPPAFPFHLNERDRPPRVGGRLQPGELRRAAGRPRERGERAPATATVLSARLEAFAGACRGPALLAARGRGGAAARSAAVSRLVPGGRTPRSYPGPRRGTGSARAGHAPERGRPSPPAAVRPRGCGGLERPSRRDSG